MYAELELALCVANTVLRRCSKQFWEPTIKLDFDRLKWCVESRMQTADLHPAAPFNAVSGVGDTPLEALQRFVKEAEAWAQVAQQNLAQRAARKAKVQADSGWYTRKPTYCEDCSTDMPPLRYGVFSDGKGGHVQAWQCKHCGTRYPRWPVEADTFTQKWVRKPR